MWKPVSESAVARTTVDRTALERWESEGGRTLALEEERLETGPGALSRSAAEGASSALPARNRGRRRERATRSSS